MDHNTTHVADAKAHLFGQHQDGPNFAAIMEATNEETQAAEDALWGMYLGLMTGALVGVPLDELGDRVGQLRGTDPLWSDDLYLRVIKVRIRANRCQGEPNELIWIVKTLTEATNVWLQDLPNAAMIISFDGLTLADDPAVKAMMMDVKAGGVRLDLVSYDPAMPFEFDDSGTGGGWGTITDPSIGGGWAHVQPA